MSEEFKEKAKGRDKHPTCFGHPVLPSPGGWNQSDFHQKAIDCQFSDKTVISKQNCNKKALPLTIGAGMTCFIPLEVLAKDPACLDKTALSFDSGQAVPQRPPGPRIIGAKLCYFHELRAHCFVSKASLETTH